MDSSKQLNYRLFLQNITDEQITLTISGEQNIFNTSNSINVSDTSNSSITLLSSNNENYNSLDLTQNLNFNNILISGTTKFVLSGILKNESYDRDIDISAGYYFINDIANILEEKLGFSKVKVVNQITFEFTDIEENDELSLTISNSFNYGYIGFENYTNRIINKDNKLIRLSRNYITKYYEKNNTYTELLENGYIETRVPPIIEYTSFIKSKTDKKLYFTENPVFDTPGITRENFEILFENNTLDIGLVDRSFNLNMSDERRIKFGILQLHGTITFAVRGRIFNSSTSDVLDVKFAFDIEPVHEYIHELVLKMNTYMEREINTNYGANSEFLKNMFKIGFTQNRFIFTNIDNWHNSTYVKVSVFFYHSSDNAFFIFDAPNIEIFDHKSKVITNDIRKIQYENNNNFVSVLTDLVDLSKRLNLLYKIYNITAYEMHYEYNVSLQDIIDQVDFTETNPSTDLNNVDGFVNFIEAMKYFVLAGDYQPSDYKNLNFELFETNNFKNIQHSQRQTYRDKLLFTPYDFYIYSYEGKLVDGPPTAFNTPDLDLPRYRPNDLLYDEIGNLLYNYHTTMIGYANDLRSLYEDFLLYNRFSCQDLNEVGNFTIQNIIDDLGPNNRNLNSSFGPGYLKEYYTSKNSANTPDSEMSSITENDGRVSIYNMKTFIFTGFYNVGDIFASRYLNRSNILTAFVTSDYYYFGFLKHQRYYTPDILRTHYTLQQIINEAGFSIQDLYDYDFWALELRYLRNLTLQQMIDTITYNKSEDKENYVNEMKYYIFSADYDIDIIKNASYIGLDNKRKTFTIQDIYIFGFIGDQNTDQRANMNIYGADDVQGDTIFRNIKHPVRPSIIFQQRFPSELVLPVSFPVEQSNNRVDPPYYTPNELRDHYSLDEIINISGFTLQHLYNYYFTSNEFRLQNVTLQRQLDQIQFIKTNGSSQPSNIPELKDFIFDGLYNIEEIAAATYYDINVEKKFTTSDFSNYAYDYVNSDYSPDKLRVSYSVAEIMGALKYFSDGSYNYQDLYNHNFTAREFNIDGTIPLQEIITNIYYDKNGTELSDRLDTMKYYIFDGSYSITEIYNATYKNAVQQPVQQLKFTPADFSIYAQQHEDNNGMYRPELLRIVFSVEEIIQGLNVYDGLYTIQRLYNNNFTAFEFNAITYPNSSELYFDKYNIIHHRSDTVSGGFNYLPVNIFYRYQGDGVNLLKNASKITHITLPNITGNVLYSTNIEIHGDDDSTSWIELNLRRVDDNSYVDETILGSNNNSILIHTYNTNGDFTKDRNGISRSKNDRITLQYLIDNIDYNKDDGLPPDREMKTYIFDASYAISEISNSTYKIGNNSFNFTLNDYAIYSKIIMYSPFDLHNINGGPFPTIDFMDEYKKNNYTLQNLYDNEFTGTQFNNIGNIELQTIVDEITFNKNVNNTPTDEMKYFIFTASYSVNEIAVIRYKTGTLPSVIPSVNDFSIYSILETTAGVPVRWIYDANSLFSFYSRQQIITGPQEDSSYTLEHFKEQYKQYGRVDFSPRIIKQVNNIERLSSLGLQNPQTYFDVGYNVFDLHDAFLVYETLGVVGITMMDVIQDSNGDNTPDSGYTIQELFYDSQGAITINGADDTGNNRENGLKYHYTITTIGNALELPPIMDIMVIRDDTNIVAGIGLTHIDQRGYLDVPRIPQPDWHSYDLKQSPYTLTHKFNSDQFVGGGDRGLMDLRLNVRIYASIFYVDKPQDNYSGRDGQIVTSTESAYNDEFLNYYFPPLQLKEYYDIPVNELLSDGGYIVSALLLENRTARELFLAGVLLTPILVTTFTYNELKDAGYSDAAITTAQSAEVTSKDLIGLGVEICEINTFTDVNRDWIRFNHPEPVSTSNEYYAELQMRRKAETLKHSNNLYKFTRKEGAKYILKGFKSVCTRGLTFSSGKVDNSNPNTKELQRVNNTLIFPIRAHPVKTTPMPGSNSNVPGNKLLYLDNRIPLIDFTSYKIPN